MTSGGSLTGDDVRQVVFAKPPLGKRGYDPHQVDAFMQRVAAALDGSDPLTADEVHNVIFGKPGIGDRGYSEEEVDALLDIVASTLRQRTDSVANPTAARSEPISGYHVRQTVLKRLPFGHGYDTSAVDAFVDRAASALDGFGSSISPDEVRNMTFPPAKRWQRGYLETQVDALLDRIVAELRRRSAGW